ncbi:MAG: lyase family protein [Chloroflexi bacterium]|nr:lyase family protein [Chloroflexota bacterium]
MAKSASYERAVGRVEGRANPFVARYMLASDLAYVLSAGELGLTPKPAVDALLQTLLDLIESVEVSGDWNAFADIVVQRESWVIDRLGPTVGGWLHLGRNRGESVRSYLPRMFFRQVLHDERLAMLDLLQALLAQAEPALEVLAPNYHHMQHAGVTTLGEYLLSWASTFQIHLHRLEQADERLDYAPSVLTARAPVKELADRVCRRLGFSRRWGLRREGIWAEDHFSEPFCVLVLVSVDLARLAEDLRLWMTPEFGLFELSDAHASGSSALPQKKNPFGLEAVIGGAAMGAGRLAGQLAANVTPSDQSDALFHAGTLYQHSLDVVAWTDFMAEVIREGTFDRDELRRKAGLAWAGTVEASDVLVFDHGVPFRTAHRVLGMLVRAESRNQPLPDISALIREETGLEVDVDQSELMAIIRTDVILPDAIDLPLIRQRWSELSKEVQEASLALHSNSPVEEAIARVVEEAKTWVSREGQE